MKMLVSGASGFVGSAATQYLAARGHAVCCLTRTAGRGDPSFIAWDPASGQIDPLGGDIDAALHLAGENVFGRWTKKKKDRIYNSRIEGTKLLAKHLAALKHKPNVLVCASAVGYYGDRRDVMLTETASAGSGFLSHVCRDWEAAAEPARAAGIRVVNLRLGMVLGPDGGALAKMLPAFKLGLGGPLGNGRQWISWVALDDVVRMIEFAIATDTLRGPVNAVAPESVTNHIFTRTLAAALHRPAVIPVPSVALKLALGDLAKEILLASTRVMPKKLIDAGFNFKHSSLKSALTAALSN